MIKRSSPHTIVHPFAAMTFAAACIVLSSATLVRANPGLIAVYSDGKQTVHRVVATPHFTLAAQQSVHSQIALRFNAVYTGALIISRGGEYKISGDAQIEVDGRNVAGKTLKLSAGEHALKVSYRRKSGSARLQLRWASDFFVEEPIPPEAFGHDENKGNKAWTQIEHGRVLYENLSCGACHGADGWNLSVRSGPDLSDISSRVTGDWLFTWLKNPRHYRKTSVMPVVLSNDSEIRDVAHYLLTLAESPVNSAASTAAPQRIAVGKELFDRVGYAKCHGETGHSLDGVGSKFRSSNALASFLADPLHVDPSGLMPQMFDPKTQAVEAVLVADYLFHTQRNNKDWSKLPAGGDVNRGRALVRSSGCLSCHLVKERGRKLPAEFKSPQFTSSSNKRLLHYWSFDGDAKDRVGTNHARIDGAGNFVAGADRIAGGKAFGFDGRTYLELAHFKRPDQMSITAWVKTSRGGEVLAWAKPQQGTREFRIGQDGRDALTYGEYNPDAGWKPVIRKSQKLVDDMWHHVAVVRDGTSAQLYLDGKPLGNAGTVQSASGAYSDNLLIGALKNGNNPNRRFLGAIDDLAIWGEPLSSETVMALARGASPKILAQGKQPELVRYDQQKGCLAAVPTRKTPDYRLSAVDRSDLRAFMGSIVEHPIVAEAPVETFYRRVKQFNCTARHALNDQNAGRALEVTDDGKIKTIERPPTLTAAGEKLRVGWLHDVLLNKKRTRPWMKMRMPHFGTELSRLPGLFPAASGSTLVDASPQPNMELTKAGLETIGEQRGQVSCIACHNYRGINRQKDGVVPAPDMAETGRTLRRDWFRRWLHAPSRMSPGTSMPQFFLQLDDGAKEQKIDELWAAIVHQSRLPLPKGLIENRTEGSKVVVGDDPVLLRVSTKIPPNMQIDRAINVGLPGGRHFTFDAAAAQLRYAWQGEFIDAALAWNGRGGNPVSVRGKSLYIATGHFPLRIGSASSNARPRFLGYYLVKKYPIFRYSVDGVEIHERIEITETHVVRRFTIAAATKGVFFVGDKNHKQTSSAGVFKEGVLEIPAAKKLEFEVRTAHR